jgi:hypothetical protein
LNSNGHKICIPEYWDGKAAIRIVDVFRHLYLSSLQ